ncbi:hypothetical protein EJB05_09626, partial [Eragrostis curvula]
MAGDQRAHRAPTSPSPETPRPSSSSTRAATPPPRRSSHASTPGHDLVPPRLPEPPHPHLAGVAAPPPRPDLASSPRRPKRPRPLRWSSVGSEDPRVRVRSPPNRLDLDSGDRGGDLDLELKGGGLDLKLRGGGLYLKLVGGGLDLRHRLVGGVLFPVRRRRWSSSFLCRGRSLLAPKLVDLAGGGRIQSGADGSMLRRHGEAGSSVMRRHGLKIYSKQYLASTAQVRFVFWSDCSFVDWSIDHMFFATNFGMTCNYLFIVTEFGMNCEARVIDVLKAMNSHGWLA